MQFTGRLVADAQLRETKTGKKVTAFTVAHNKSYRNSEGEKVQQTTFVDCSYWNRPNITEYLTKGVMLNLRGFVSSSAWVDRDGHARAGIRMEVDDVDFLGGGKRDTQPENNEEQENKTKGKAKVKKAERVTVNKDDDLPF